MVPRPSALAMYRALVGVGLFCGLVIVSVFQLTRPIILRNQIEARQRAIFQVLPGTITSVAFRVTPQGGVEAVPSDSDGEGLVFAGYAEGGDLVGLAIEASGMGYQDVVRILYGYSLEKQAVVGIQVLESRETPGLGDRVESDPDFLANFESLDVSLDPSGEALAHPIEAVKHGAKAHPWQIDCITGATITSKTVANMLRESTAWWVPRLVRSVDGFEKTE